jgi:hypothetical protein
MKTGGLSRKSAAKHVVNQSSFQQPRAAFPEGVRDAHKSLIGETFALYPDVFFVCCRFDLPGMLPMPVQFKFAFSVVASEAAARSSIPVLGSVRGATRDQSFGDCGHLTMAEC